MGCESLHERRLPPEWGTTIIFLVIFISPQRAAFADAEKVFMWRDPQKQPFRVLSETFYKGKHF